MSDSQARPPEATADAVMRQFTDLREHLRGLAHAYAVDDPRRAAFEAAALVAENTEWQVQRILAAPAPVRATARVPAVPSQRRRGVGEGTGAWLAGQSPTMRRNRGHQ